MRGTRGHCLSTQHENARKRTANRTTKKRGPQLDPSTAEFDLVSVTMPVEVSSMMYPLTRFVSANVRDRGKQSFRACTSCRT